MEVAARHWFARLHHSERYYIMYLGNCTCYYHSFQCYSKWRVRGRGAERRSRRRRRRRRGSFISSEQAGLGLTPSLLCCGGSASVPCAVLPGTVPSSLHSQEGVSVMKAFVAGVFLLVAAAVPVLPLFCNPPFPCYGVPSSFKFHNWCYFVAKGPGGENAYFNWYQAKAFCRKISAELASPTDMLAIGLALIYYMPGTWIGATDSQGSKWYFLDGRQVHCSYFKEQPPKPDPANQLCGIAYLNKRKPFITPTPCIERHPAICARWIGKRRDAEDDQA
ncbi:uncharacterized protein LOC135095818 [Scylla paramamosain]|uniref:uncharacterized protein LOC135095818 n=1 Tax=Scylla paramamosain TaxID=85552 RepID=UPI003082E3BF